METEINIVEILKDKPANTKLYSPLFSEVFFSHVSGGYIAVEHHGGTSLFLSSGRFYDYDGSEPLLFPSKEMRDWSKFAWEKGDVLVNENNAHIIFEKFTDDTYTTFIGRHYLNKNYKNYVPGRYTCVTQHFHIEESNAAQIYIYNIEEKIGGKLDLKTLEIEKQLEFKDGDIVVYGESVAICRRFYKHTLSFYISLNEMFGLLFADEVESSEEYRFATDEEKQQLFEALAKKGKAWDAEKKQIVDLKPKVDVLKPFDRVLVRNCKSENWRANLFCYIDKDGFYCCVWANWAYCIPYIGNESLVGTTKDVEG